MKNVVALVSGICHGLGYGDNFQAVLVSNAVLEMQRFLDHVSPASRNLAQSAYLGDLLVTAYSQFSRNRTFGNMIGRGYSVTSAQMEMNMVAEGYYAVDSLWLLNQRYQVSMPILEAAHAILYDKQPAVQVITQLQDKFY
jgi:glycerol-3-phosphate dehydrogenase (NAD(P)+)